MIFSAYSHRRPREQGFFRGPLWPWPFPGGRDTESSSRDRDTTIAGVPASREEIFMSFPADVPVYLRHYFLRPNTGTAEHCLFFLVNTGGIFMIGRLEEPSETIGTERWRSISDQRKLGPPAVDYLVSNLQDSDKKVRLAAVDALGEIGRQTGLRAPGRVNE